jgi:hypothetical protein
MRHSDSKAPIFLAAVLMTLALNLHADPIQDGALAAYRAGWFANTGTCAETCKAKTPGSLAEYEASPVPHTKRAFVCRVAGKSQGDIRTWLYGSQFDDRAACYTTGLDLKGSHAPKYFCLCVVK